MIYRICSQPHGAELSLGTIYETYLTPEIKGRVKIRTFRKWHAAGCSYIRLATAGTPYLLLLIAFRRKMVQAEFLQAKATTAVCNSLLYPKGKVREDGEDGEGLA